MALNDETCAAPGCSNLSSRRGEHVLPNWLMRAFTSHVWPRGPYSAGNSRSGLELESTQPAYAKLPCCKVHNAQLDTVFETHGHKAAKRLFGIESLRNDKGRTDYALLPLEQQPPLDQAEADRFARWLAKTMVLLNHPRTVEAMNSQPVWADRDRAAFPTSVFADIFNGTVPEGLHLWITVSELGAGETEYVDVGARVQLDRSLRHPVAGASRGLALRPGAAGLFLNVQVVWAPGLIVVHPDEETGAAVRVWPCPPAPLRIADLPVLDEWTASRFRSTFYIGGVGFAHEAGRTPVIAEGVSTLAVTDTARGHDLHWWDFMNADARIDAVVLHLRRTGVLQGEITRNGSLTD